MDPVSEAERMEGFGTSPLLTLRLKDSSFHLNHKYHSTAERTLVPRQTTEVSLSTIGSPSSDFHTPSSPPLKGSTHSGTSKYTPLPPILPRSQSMPDYNSNSLSFNSPSRRSSSLRGTVPRVRSPRKPVDEIFVGFPNRSSPSLPRNIDQALGDDTLASVAHSGSVSPANTNNATTCRSIRPESPRLNLQQTSPSNPCLSPCSFTYQPPACISRLGDQNYTINYCYSGSLSYPSSFSCSIPSTPTSARSRSSSISSLETIPDSPDAEEAALIEDQISCHKPDVGALDNCEVTKRRIPRDINTSRARMFGTGFVREKRKRWSVCGGERRGDLNLDTIWED